MNHLSVLDPFFHLSDGDLTRDKTPKGGWLEKAKDVRLVRGYVLRATCRRRFLGWRSSALELSEREVSDSIGPHAVRIARDEDADSLFTKPVPIPLTSKNIQSLDTFVGNDDGVLVRVLQGGDFSRTCSDVTLVRATLLLASLPKADGAINLAIMVLEDPELQALKAAVDKEREWKKQMEEKARKASEPAKDNLTETKLQDESNHESAQQKLLFCCIPIKKSQNKSASNTAKTVRASQRSPAGSVALNPQAANSPSGAAAAANGGGPVGVQPVVEIGTPSIPALHRDAVDRTVRQIAQAAASESWDPSWRRIGAADGLTWLLKDGSKMIMVRGTIHAPARTVFEYVWADDPQNLLLIEPRISDVRAIEKDLDGTGHTKTQMRTVSPEWAFASGIQDEADLVEMTCLRHYHVHPDGTIFVLELCGQESGGIVISPVQGDEYSCYVAWVETPSSLKRAATMTPRPAPWASSRLGAMTAKVLGDRLHALSKYGLSRAPYSNFDDAISRGHVVNHNGSSGATVITMKSSGSSLMKEKMREFDELAVTHNSNSVEAKHLLQKQIEAAAELVMTSIPEERKRFRASFEQLKQEIDSFISSPRSTRIRNAAQYVFDCIMIWVLSTLPTEESWVEVLAEQIAMRNVEAQSTFGRRVENVSDPSSFNRISQIMSRDRERPPSL